LQESVVFDNDLGPKTGQQSKKIMRKKESTQPSTKRIGQQIAELLGQGG